MAYRGQGIDLGSLFALGRAGTGLLAAPRIIAGEDRANLQDRMLLQQLGATPEQLEGIAPRPAITLPGGTVGKILEGVGTTGAIFNAMLGGNIPAPRPDIGDIAAVGQLMYKRKETTAARDALNEAAGLFKSPLAQSLARAGKTEAAVRADRADDVKLPTNKFSARVLSASGQASPEVQAAIDQAVAEDDYAALGRQKAYQQFLQEPGTVAGAAGRAGAIAGATAQERTDVQLDPANVAGAAGRAGQIAGATGRAREDVLNDPAYAKARYKRMREASRAQSTGRREGERAGQLGAVENLMTEMEGAVDRRLKAPDLLGRIQQGVGMMAFKASPKTAAAIMGMDPDEAARYALDMERIEQPRAFAGLVIKALGIDAGALAEGDIARISERFATKWDAGIVAKAKLKVLRSMVDSLAGTGRDNPAAQRDAMARVLMDFDTAEEDPDSVVGAPATGEEPPTTPGATAPTGGAPAPGRPRTAEEYKAMRGLR